MGVATLLKHSHFVIFISLCDCTLHYSPVHAVLHWLSCLLVQETIISNTDIPPCGDCTGQDDSCIYGVVNLTPAVLT